MSNIFECILPSIKIIYIIPDKEITILYNNYGHLVTKIDNCYTEQALTFSHDGNVSTINERTKKIYNENTELRQIQIFIVNNYEIPTTSSNVYVLFSDDDGIQYHYQGNYSYFLKDKEEILIVSDLNLITDITNFALIH